MIKFGLVAVAAFFFSGSLMAQSPSFIYTNDFDDDSTLADFAPLAGGWSIRRGSLIARTTAAPSQFAMAVNEDLHLPARYFIQVGVHASAANQFTNGFGPVLPTGTGAAGTLETVVLNPYTGTNGTGTNQTSASATSYLIYDFKDALNYKWVKFERAYGNGFMTRVSPPTEGLYCSLGRADQGDFRQIQGQRAQCAGLMDMHYSHASLRVLGKRVTLFLNNEPVLDYTFAQPIVHDAIGFLAQGHRATAAFDYLHVIRAD